MENVTKEWSEKKKAKKYGREETTGNIKIGEKVKNTEELQN